MERIVDYYFTPQSPWSFLGHARLLAMADARRVTVRPRVADFARIFAASGGLPLAQRPPQRRSYRLLELERFAAHFGNALHVAPRHFPVDPQAASLRIASLVVRGDAPAALRYAGAVMRALWIDDRDIADADTLDAIAGSCGLDPVALAAAGAEETAGEALRIATDEAIAAEVFGAPTYVPRFGPAAGQRFWGQDRLDFLERALPPA